ncbi:22623_t:CDS:2, partial [Racocetra persica]
TDLTPTTLNQGTIGQYWERIDRHKVDDYLSKLKISSAQIYYTNVIDLGSYCPPECVSQYYYNNDSSGQDAQQNFTATKNIEAVYNYFGMDHGISSEIMDKYDLPTRQQGKRVTVKNGIQNPQHHDIAFILGDNMSIAASFKTKF